MIILTRHCKEQIKKRLLKKKDVKPIEIWKKSLEFIKNSRKFEDPKFIYFTNGKYTLVVTKKRINGIPKSEAIDFIRDLKRDTFYVYYKDALLELNKDKLLELLKKSYNNVIVSKHGDIFFGEAHIAITLRPSKPKERMEYKLFGELIGKPEKIDKIAIGLAITYINKQPWVVFVVDERYNALYSPGGTKEDGETDFETLKRELKEELGLDLIRISDKYISTYVYSPKKKSYMEIRSYIGEVKGELKINLEEIKSVLIFKYEDITEDLLKWLNQKYLLGPSVIDCFINKRKELDRIIRNF